jgi:acetyl-CoA/propionyl-CoA carboxylase, biotin carboxylase, biotin carboxyl carrier protein
VFAKILVANRGEIAVRVIRTLRSVGIGSVAVYSDADADARHVRDADLAIRLGPAAATESYLDAGRIVAAAVDAGAQAVHPGYGFLAENAGFARDCAAAGLVFIGPPPEAIEAMGDKIRARDTAAAAGVPVVPGAGRPGMSDNDLIAAADRVGFPVLIKPSAGGGGKGMRVVNAKDQLPDGLAGARREARAAFADGTLLLERYLDRPRHIEIQVLADGHGNVVHLGERECSIQRRHQKIIEEAPSPLLDQARREAMGAAAVTVARSVGYTGAGTVEFILASDRPDDFYFMEMNTRLQVEHPVTELVTGIDLVEWQIRVAAGEPLPSCLRGRRIGGHAVEARVYAEDPTRGFLPTGGTVLAVREPDLPHVRVDSGLSAGTAVTTAYDPMLAKVCAWGPDRATALRRLDRALADTTVLGVATNIGFLRDLLSDPDVQAGRLDTGLAERAAGQAAPASVPDDVLAAAALERLLASEPAGPLVDPWDIPDGWRPGGHAWTKLRFVQASGVAAEVRVRGRAATGAEVAAGEGELLAAHAALDGDDLLVTSCGRTTSYARARQGRTVWLGRDGQAWALTEEEPTAAADGRPGNAGGTIRAPMPGTVLSVQVNAGQPVRSGQPLVTVEAMKMEHTVTAPADGVVTEVTARAGQQVRMGETLAVLQAKE